MIIWQARHKYLMHMAWAANLRQTGDKVQEHINIAAKAVQNVTQALNAGMIPDQYQNKKDLSIIMNVVLQGENNSNNKELYNIGISIFNKYKPKIEKITIPSGLDNNGSRDYTVPQTQNGGNQMRKQILILLVLVGLVFSSCSKNKIENTIDGIWSMDTIYYSKYDIRLCLGNNILEFNRDKSKVPVAMNRCGSFIKKSYDSFAKVEIVDSELENDTIPFRLRIKTENEIFSGTHKIVFYKDEVNQLLKMEIFSDSLYIVCRKGLFDFNGNIALINHLEEVSWTTRPNRNSINKK